jgi:hypothetical protein
MAVFLMELTWSSRNTAWKCKRERVHGNFDPLRTVYGRKPIR